MSSLVVCKIKTLARSVALISIHFWPDVLRLLRTWVLSEETFGASEVLPNKGRVSFKVVHENFVQSFRPIDSINNVRVYKDEYKETKMYITLDILKQF